MRNAARVSKLIGRLVVLFAGCMAGCTTSNRQIVMMGLDAKELSTLRTRWVDVGLELRNAKATAEYRYVFEEISRRSPDWVWAVAYYDILSTISDTGKARENVAVLVLYEDRTKGMGYITNTLVIPVDNRLARGELAIAHEVLGAPRPNASEKGRRYARRLEEAAESLHRLVNSSAGREVTMDPEGRALEATAAICVVEFSGPKGRSSAVCVNSLQLDRADSGPGDRLTALTYDIVDVWMELLATTRAAASDMVGQPLFGTAESEGGGAQSAPDE